MIRKAKYKDFKDIQKIFELGFTDEYKQRGINIVKRIKKWQQIYPIIKLLATFNNPYQHIFNVHVYEDDEEKKVVGLIQTSARSKDHTRWHIENISVLPDQRGKGIAKKLINYVFDNYINKGVNRFTLEVDVNNIPAIKLYESIGFRKYTTIHYYKLIPKDIFNFKSGKIKVPDGLRKYKDSDAAGCLELYISSTPSCIRIVDQKNIDDFKDNPLEKLSKYLKEVTKKSRNLNFVVEKDSKIIASLEILAQYRQLPHVIRLLVHPAYENLNEELLIYSFNLLNDYPQRTVLIAASEHQKAKINAIEKLKLKKISSDHLMVKDNFQLVKLSDKASDVIKDNNNLNPIFSSKDYYAIRKNSR
jgi:ribosomal protein S18 acetylase RimI-like enzyme